MFLAKLFDMKLATLAVHAGRHVDPATGAVTPPIHLSTTFERGAAGDYPLGFLYSREDNPNRRMLEKCLAELEGGEDAIVFSSGLAVLTGIMQGLDPGDHIVVAQDVYHGLRKVVHTLFASFPLEVTYVDMTDLDAVAAAMRPRTQIVWVETPSNPLLKITDLDAVAQIAREKNVLSVCDSTFCTPFLQRPLEHGIDMVMHSTTKYISGHSDVLGGALITKWGNRFFERARNSQRYGGAVPSPFDCWLTLRSISSLACRMRMHVESAATVARFLHRHPMVEKVHYPGLADHPGHDIAARQMSDFGAMLSFQVRGDSEEAMAVAAAVKIFTRATSLGGPHSFIEHRASIEGPQTTTPPNLLRLSIGLEDASDLTADLDHALSSIAS